MEQNPNLTQAALQKGLITGLISSMATYALYLISVEALFGMASFGILTIIIAIIVFFSLQLRQLNGGYFRYKEAFSSTFIIAFTSTVIGGIFTYILYNFLDPSLSEELKRYTIESTEKVMESFGGGSEAMDAAMEQLENEDYSMTFGKIIKQVLVGGVVWAVISAIIAAIIKKKEPEDFLQ